MYSLLPRDDLSQIQPNLTDVARMTDIVIVTELLIAGVFDGRRISCHSSEQSSSLPLVVELVINIALTWPQL